MREVSLNGQKFGINRLRYKGGASPETLYDLVNAYLTPERKFKRRGGFTKVTTLVAGTKGLAAYNTKLYVYSATAVTQTHTLFAGTVVPYPTGPGPTVSKIWFARPFLSRMYVAAEFSNGNIFHYWIQNPGAWAANTTYIYRQQVQPIVPNGYVYEATNIDTSLAWSPNTVKALTNKVQPTTYNGFTYTVTNTLGVPITTSDTEPEWPITEGATIREYRYLNVPGAGTTTTPPSTPTPPTTPPSDPTIPERYPNTTPRGSTN